METLGAVTLTAAAVGAILAVVAWRTAGLTYFKFRGRRVVTCPETSRPAGVDVDAGHAARSALCPHPRLRLASCSRWPERSDCGQACLKQIEAAPEECLVRGILTRWYKGKSCARCQKAFDVIEWEERKPALLDASHTIRDLGRIAAEELPDALATSQAVCWECRVTATERSTGS